MSTAETVPAWRCRFPGCEQPLAFDSTTRCFYHQKLEALPILNGADSRATYGNRGPGNHSGRVRPRYDYPTWFDGQPHTLTQGVDFPADMKSMLSMLRRAAVRLGADVIVSHTGPVITVQARPKSQEGAA